MDPQQLLKTSKLYSERKKCDTEETLGGLVPPPLVARRLGDHHRYMYNCTCTCSYCFPFNPSYELTDVSQVQDFNVYGRSSSLKHEICIMNNRAKLYPN